MFFAAAPWLEPVMAVASLWILPAIIFEIFLAWRWLPVYDRRMVGIAIVAANLLSALLGLPIAFFFGQALDALFAGNDKGIVGLVVLGVIGYVSAILLEYMALRRTLNEERPSRIRSFAIWVNLVSYGFWAGAVAFVLLYLKVGGKA